MDFALIGRSMIVFLFFAVTLTMNVDDNLLARLGLGGNFALIFALSVFFTAIMVGRSMLIVGTAVVLCLVANMPADFTLNFGFDRDYYAGILVALLLQPVIARAMG